MTELDWKRLQFEAETTDGNTYTLSPVGIHNDGRRNVLIWGAFSGATQVGVLAIHASHGTCLADPKNPLWWANGLTILPRTDVPPDRTSTYGRVDPDDRGPRIEDLEETTPECIPRAARVLRNSVKSFLRGQTKTTFGRMFNHATTVSPLVKEVLPHINITDLERALRAEGWVRGHKDVRTWTRSAPQPEPN